MYTEQVKAGKTPLEAQKAVAAKYGAGQSALSSKAGSVEIPSGTKGLMEEAKKYKSADEFVKAQGDSIYHGTPFSFKEFDTNKS